MLDLSTLFDYDLWATRRWMHALAGFQDLGRAHEILEHMLFAQRVWLERLGVEFELQTGTEQTQAVFDRLNRKWKQIAEEANLDAQVEYKTSGGAEFVNTVSEIGLHVVNHGTYHRGQLRGLAESEGWDGFPDTDLILFLRES